MAHLVGVINEDERSTGRKLPRHMRAIVALRLLTAGGMQSTELLLIL